MNARASLYQQYHKKHRHPTIPGSSNDAQGRPRHFQTESASCLRAYIRAKAQQGDYAGAIALLTELIDRNPTSAVDYNNRGLIYFQSGQLANAIADYNKALKLNPQLDSAYNNRANYYAAQKLLSEAIGDYEIALDLNPRNIRAWINLGITFRELGQYSRALDNFEFALHFGQLASHIYAERGRTYHLLGDWNCAISDYRRFLELEPPSDATSRLRLQVENWMNDLLNPLSHKSAS